MAGTLLRTGNLQEFHPLGAVGNPVYLSASQLRSALRRQLGAEVVDTLAIPQRNEDGDTIDWYAPIAGAVVPWSAATVEERRQAKADLLQIRERIRETSQAMRAETDRERQVFGQLLDLVTLFPNDTHVYLVNARPVITFWGFQERDAPAGSDPLLYLPVADEDSTLPVIPEGVATPPRRRLSRWWLLLPLLLLLLLSLWLLKTCREEPWVELGPLIGSVEPPVASPSEDGEPTPDEEPLRVIETVPEVGAVPGAVGIDSGVEGSAPGTLLPETPIEGTEPALPETGLPAPETEIPDTEGRGPEDTSAIPEEEIPEETPSSEPGQDDSSAQTPPEAGPETAPQEPPPGPPTSAQPEQTESGPPLQIPQEALDSGSTEFLDGSWRSSTSLMDSNTGLPIELEYAFKEGAGTVTLKRDGVVCTGKTQASMQGGQLVITDEGDILCPDGTAYRGSRVECRSRGQGPADCSGRYPTGDTFSTQMQKAE